MKTAIVLTFERLPVCGLGAYGGVGRTPNIDRFAAGAVTFDGHFVHAVPPGQPHVWWTGGRSHPGETASVIGALNARGVETHALVETAEAADLEVPSEFAAIWETASPGDPAKPGRRGFAGLVETACETLAEWRDETEPRPRLLWMRAVGLADRKELPTLSDVPEFVAALDAEFEPLAAAMDEFERHRECLTILSAALGMRFTEQENLPADFRLPEYLTDLTQSVVQTPLVVRLAGVPAGTRRSGFTQPVDIAATLLDWFDVDAGGIAVEGNSLLPSLSTDAAASKREQIVIRDAAGNRTVRTVEFALVARRGAWEDVESEESESPATPLEDVFLFVKPDDYWDVHNVAGQEPALVHELLSRIRGEGE